MPNVVAAIVGAATFGASFFILLFLGIFKAGRGVQQLRWCLLLFGCLVAGIAYGSVALNQPYVTRPDGTGTRSVEWGLPTLHVLTMTAVTTVVTLGLFHSLGARLLPVTVTLLLFGCLALGIYNDGFGLWWWYLVACILFVCDCLAVLLVDKQEYVSDVVKRREHEPFVQQGGGLMKGLVWRVLLLFCILCYLILWAIDQNTSGVVPTYTLSIILNVILDFFVVVVFAFLVFFFLAPIPFDDLDTLGLTASAREANKGAQFGNGHSTPGAVAGLTARGTARNYALPQ